MVFSVTFNNISVIPWRSVLLVDKTGENYRPVTDKLYHIMLHRVHLTCVGFELTTLLVIYTDCIRSCKSSYHTITTTSLLCCSVSFFFKIKVDFKYYYNDVYLWIYNYLYNQCLSPLTLWFRIPFMWSVLDTTLCDNVCQWLVAGR